jgi:hypothetical protein
MAQDTPVKTPEEWAKIKEAAEAEAAALDAQRKVIEARKQLEAAQKPDDPVKKALEDKAAAAKQAADIATSQKTQAEASLATLKTKFDVPTSGYTGDVKLSDKAGATEAALLAAKALDVAATKIAANIEAPAQNRTLLLYANGDVPTFQALIAFNAQVAIVEKSLSDAVAKSDEIKVKAPLPAQVHVEFAPAIPAAGLALDAVNKLLGFFRTDYNVGGVEVKLDDALLVHALAGKLAKISNLTVQLPAIYNAGAIKDSGSTVLNKLADLAKRKAELQAIAEYHDKVAAAFSDLASKETDSGKKKDLLDRAKLNKEAADGLRAAIAIHDSFFSKLTAADDKSMVPLTSVIRDSVVSDLLKNNGLVMAVRLATSGGAYYTKKNMWTFFGGMPFHNMGGVVVSFVLIEGTDGHVLKSGAIPVDGGFVKSDELKTFLGK